jgi:hypothetical protein
MLAETGIEPAPEEVKSAVMRQVRDRETRDGELAPSTSPLEAQSEAGADLAPHKRFRLRRRFRGFRPFAVAGLAIACAATGVVVAAHLRASPAQESALTAAVTTAPTMAATTPPPRPSTLIAGATLVRQETSKKPGIVPGLPQDRPAGPKPVQGARTVLQVEEPVSLGSAATRLVQRLRAVHRPRTALQLAVRLRADAQHSARTLRLAVKPAAAGAEVVSIRLSPSSSSRELVGLMVDALGNRRTRTVALILPGQSPQTLRLRLVRLGD